MEGGGWKKKKKQRERERPAMMMMSSTKMSTMTSHLNGRTICHRFEGHRGRFRCCTRCRSSTSSPIGMSIFKQNKKERKKGRRRSEWPTFQPPQPNNRSLPTNPNTLTGTHKAPTPAHSLTKHPLSLSVPSVTSHPPTTRHKHTFGDVCSPPSPLECQQRQRQKPQQQQGSQCRWRVKLRECLGWQKWQWRESLELLGRRVKYLCAPWLRLGGACHWSRSTTSPGR